MFSEQESDNNRYHSYYNNEKIIKDRLKSYNNIEFIKGDSVKVIPLILKNNSKEDMYNV